MNNIDIIKSALETHCRERKLHPNDITPMQLAELRDRFERLINNFPIEHIVVYKKALEMLKDSFDGGEDFQEIDSIVSEKIDIAQKSSEMAKSYLKHIAFKIDTSANIRIVANGKLLRGVFSLQMYQDILEKHLHGDKTYWEIFKEAIMHASTIYSPVEKQYFFSEENHCYLNTYIAPTWKSLNLQPKEYSALNPVLRAFLEHLFPEKNILKHVLKWCAYSLTHNLQTYLTLIGQPGIGKTIFAQDFMGYYHGYDNLNLISRIENLTIARNLNSTLLYLDEMSMNQLEQYNIMKKFTNDLVGSNSFGKRNIQNFSNIIWSSNTKDAMAALSSDDRRFKIVPITDKMLNYEITAFADDHSKIMDFTYENIVDFKNNLTYKNELVSHFLYIIANEKAINDINTIEENVQKADILFASRDPEFLEIFDILTNIKNDFNLETKRKIDFDEYTPPMLKNMGIPFKDFVPLSSLIKPKEKRFTVRIPYAVIKNVMDIRKEKGMALNYYRFYKEAEKMPESICKVKCVMGTQIYDLELNLPNFDPEMKDILKNYDYRFVLNGDPTMRVDKF